MPILNPIDLNPMDAIHVVVASDNHFAVMLAALLKSLAVNKSLETQVFLYVISDGITDSNKDKVVYDIDSYAVRVQWINMRDVVPDDFHFPIDSSGFPLTTYLRLLAPYVVPSEVKRLIYLDVDMLVLGDLQELLNYDLHGHVIGAVTDRSGTVGCEWAGIPNYMELGLKAEDKYFNAGLLLIDCMAWRDGNYTYKVLENMRINKAHVIFGDQYGLNVTFANKWEELPLRWNTYSEILSDDVVIVHFVGVKPIYSSYNFQSSYRELFYRYLSQTGFSEYKPEPQWFRIWIKIKNIIKKKFIRLVG